MNLKLKYAIRFSLIILLGGYSELINCQESEINYAQKIATMTTLIYTYTPTGKYQATGFFYNSGEKSYVVSNRHVFFPNERYPDSIVFYLKVDDPKGIKPVVWFPVRIDKKYLLDNLKLHKNKDVDVAAILTDSVYSTFKKPWPNLVWAVTQPDSVEIEVADPEIGDDILVLGYPKGYYDEYHLIPVMKAGIIASFYRTNFNNLPCFLIDSRLFHGSSGSIVIAKTKDFFFSKGEPMISPKKDFIFLGIFSGEPYLFGPQTETDEAISIKKEYMDLGLVWYPWVIDELR